VVVKEYDTVGENWEGCSLNAESLSKATFDSKRGIFPRKEKNIFTGCKKRLVKIV
jgi:hypothetical protein